MRPRVSAIRTVVLLAFSALFLPGLIFVYLALSLIHTNLEEIRSLPNTYLFLLQGICVFWLVNAAINWVALTGRLEWLARLLIGVGCLIFLFDGFRGLWLNSWWQVALAGCISVAVIVAVAAGIRRIELRTLLFYAAFLVLIPVTATLVTHVQTLGPKLIWNVTKEIFRPLPDKVANHPEPWKELSADAKEIDGAIELARISSAAPGVVIQKGKMVRVSNQGAPGATVATLPVSLPPSDTSVAVAEIRVHLLAGDLSLGVPMPQTDRWFYRADALESEGERHTFHVPLHPGTREIDLVFINGRIGQHTFTFEIEEAKVYGLMGRIGESQMETVGIRQVGNACEILLDGYEQCMFHEIVEENEDLWFDGFTLYENFRTFAYPIDSATS